MVTFVEFDNIRQLLVKSLTSTLIEEQHLPLTEQSVSLLPCLLTRQKHTITCEFGSKYHHYRGNVFSIYPLNNIALAIGHLNDLNQLLVLVAIIMY